MCPNSCFTKHRRRQISYTDDKFRPSSTFTQSSSSSSYTRNISKKGLLVNKVARIHHKLEIRGNGGYSLTLTSPLPSSSSSSLTSDLDLSDSSSSSSPAYSQRQKVTQHDKMHKLGLPHKQCCICQLTSFLLYAFIWRSYSTFRFSAIATKGALSQNYTNVLCHQAHNKQAHSSIYGKLTSLLIDFHSSPPALPTCFIHIQCIRGVKTNL